MKHYDIVLLTQDGLETLSDIQDPVDQAGFQEDDLLMTALQKLGIRVHRVSWSDPNFDWASTHCALFRTTWDYSHRFKEFYKWLMEVKTKTTLINDAEHILWNLDKHYLSDLKSMQSFLI